MHHHTKLQITSTENKILVCFPNTHTTKNSYEIAQELKNIHIKENNWMITLDIKDLYVNVHTQNILHIHEFLLNKHNQDKTTTGQILQLRGVILKQNYFQ